MTHALALPAAPLFAASPDSPWTALLTGASAILAATITAGWALLGERLRARHDRLRETETLRAQAEETRAQDLRDAFAGVQAAVLRLGLTVRIFLDLRMDEYARIGGEDMTDQIRQAREDYLAALVALESLWTLTDDPGVRGAIEELRSAASAAFGHARSAGGRVSDPEGIERLMLAALRELGAALFPPAAPGAES